jgi:hypothetical protein
MRPVPSRVPLLWLVSLLALALSVQVGLRLIYQSTKQPSEVVENDYQNPRLEAELRAALVWLGQNLQWRPQDLYKPEANCDNARVAIPKDMSSLCAMSRLDASLANTAHTVRGTAAEVPPPELVRPLSWLARHVRQGERLLEMIEQPQRAAAQGRLRDPFRLDGCIAAPKAPMPSGGWSGDCAGALNTKLTELMPSATTATSRVLRYVHPDRAAAPNTVEANANTLLSTPLRQGRHLELGLDPQLQAAAQRTVACYTGQVAACAQCPWCNTAGASAMFEGARARAMGILVVDVHTGLIEAAGSAYTPCYEAQHRGKLLEPGCPLLPQVSDDRRVNLSRLENLALFGQGMPGSEVKPVIALALTRSGLSATELAALPSILTRSATEELIDLVLCKERGFVPTCAQRRLNEIATLSPLLGWQASTEALALDQVPEFKQKYFAGRLLQLPAPADRKRPIPMLDQDALRECGDRPMRLRWRNCRTADLADVVAELFGQGNALLSPLGAASSMLALAAAGNGLPVAAQAHLVSMVQEADSSFRVIDQRRASAVTFEGAGPVLRGLERTHLAGTAQSACRAARAVELKREWGIACSEQEAVAAAERGQPPLPIASKTGTPVFSGDRRTLGAWRVSCEQVEHKLIATKSGSPSWYQLRNERAKCKRPPLKWYAALVGSPTGSSWTKVVVVLAERNWNLSSQMIDSVDDRGPNVAAEAALALINVWYASGEGTRSAVPSVGAVSHIVHRAGALQ